MKRSRRIQMGCAGVGCVAPLLLLTGLFVVFTFNNRPPRLVIPTPTPPANNGYDDFVRAAQMIMKIKHKAPSSMVNPPTTRAGYLAQTRACTQDSAVGLALLRSAFEKPYLTPPARTYQSLPGPYASFREVARTITGVEEYYELIGQPGRAADAALDGEEMGVIMPRGGALIADLVGIAIEAICLHRFEHLLPLLSPKELEHVASRLERIAAKRVPFSVILLEEGYSSVASLQAAMNDPKLSGIKGNYDSVRALLTYDCGPADDGRRMTVKEGWNIGRFMLKNKSAMLADELRFYEALSKEARRPITLKSNVPIPDSPSASFFDLYSANTPRRTHVVKESVLNVLRIEVALYRFKAGKGRFPTQLAELAPQYLPVIPCDPFTGASNQQYRYSILNHPTGFVLYGRGSDTVDHGGKFARFAGDKGFDIVAGHISRAMKLFP